MYYFGNLRLEQDSIKLRLLSYLLFAIGLMPYYLLPVWAGVFEDSYQFAGSQIAALLAADMVGGTVAAFFARFWIARSRWRPILLLSLLTSVAVNIACAVFDAFGTLLLLRTFAGLSAGTFMALVYAVFSNTQNPDRQFSIALAIQVMLGAGAIWIAPHLLASWGRASLFVLVGLASLLPLFLITTCPERGPGNKSERRGTGPPVPWRVWLGLVTICLFMISLSCVWVAMERLAKNDGLDAPVVASVLSAALAFSFLGAAAPALTSSLAPRKLQVYASYSALFVAIAVIGSDTTVWLLAGGLAVYNFFFSFVIPFQTAWVAETDPTGRNAVLVPLAQGIGVSVGPFVGGALLATGNYATVIQASIAILVASFICVYLAGDPIQV